MSGKKGMKIKKRKPMSQETRKQISKTMKNKWKEKERDKRLEKYVKNTGRNIVFIWEHEINDEWFCILDYLPYESVVMLYD